ncbi:Uncharacterised protein [Vibrio paracholerae]|nr:Uncharacterised protein [Vibrio paracholerae]
MHGCFAETQLFGNRHASIVLARFLHHLHQVSQAANYRLSMQYQ